MRTSDLKELLATVQGLRLELHPELDAAFVEAVVVAEEANPDDDSAAEAAIEAALKACLVRLESSS